MRNLLSLCSCLLGTTSEGRLGGRFVSTVMIEALKSDVILIPEICHPDSSIGVRWLLWCQGVRYVRGVLGGVRGVSVVRNVRNVRCIRFIFIEAPLGAKRLLHHPGVGELEGAGLLEVQGVERRMVSIKTLKVISPQICIVGSLLGIRHITVV